MDNAPRRWHEMVCDVRIADNIAGQLGRVAVIGGSAE